MLPRSLCLQPKRFKHGVLSEGSFVSGTRTRLLADVTHSLSLACGARSGRWAKQEGVLIEYARTGVSDRRQRSVSLSSLRTTVSRRGGGAERGVCYYHERVRRHLPIVSKPVRRRLLDSERDFHSLPSRCALSRALSASHVVYCHDLLAVGSRRTHRVWGVRGVNRAPMRSGCVSARAHGALLPLRASLRRTHTLCPCAHRRRVVAVQSVAESARGGSRRAPPPNPNPSAAPTSTQRSLSSGCLRGEPPTTGDIPGGQRCPAHAATPLSGCAS